MLVSEGGRLKSGLGPPYSISDDLKSKADILNAFIPLSAPRAGQKAYIRFKRHGLARVMGINFMNVVEATASEDVISAAVQYGRDYLIRFYFDPKLELRLIKPGPRFIHDYGRLVEEKHVPPKIEDYIEILRSEISYWNGESWSKGSGKEGSYFLKAEPTAMMAKPALRRSA